MVVVVCGVRVRRKEVGINPIQHLNHHAPGSPSRTICAVCPSLVSIPRGSHPGVVGTPRARRSGVHTSFQRWRRVSCCNGGVRLSGLCVEHAVLLGLSSTCLVKGAEVGDEAGGEHAVAHQRRGVGLGGWSASE